MTARRPAMFTTLTAGLLVQLAACSGTPVATASPSAVPTEVAPSPSPSTAQISPTPSEQAGLTSGAAVVLADDLRVRANPALDAVEMACEGALESRMRLAAGDVVWITDEESRVQDGYLWYQVVAPDHGCNGSELALVAGWVAAGPVDDPRWMEGFDEDCPEPTAATDLPGSPLARLGCYAGQTLTLHGDRPRPPEGGIGFTCPGIEPLWLTCGIDTFGPTADGDTALIIRIPPGVQSSAYGPVVVTGEFDDGRARDCSEAANHFSAIVVQVYCRTQFVVQSMASSQ